MEGKTYFKVGRKIKAYVDFWDSGGRYDSDGWHAHTGKPSDASSLGWGPFATKEEAIAVAKKFMDAYCETPFGTMIYKITEG